MPSSNDLSSDPNAEERREYSQIPLQEPSEDVAEIKKAAATAPYAGIMNHPGMFWTLLTDVRLMAHQFRVHCVVVRCAALPVLCYCLASIMMTVINKVRTASPYIALEVIKRS